MLEQKNKIIIPHFTYTKTETLTELCVLRYIAGISSARFAEIAGVGPAYYASVETGVFSGSLPFLNKIYCKFLELAESDDILNRAITFLYDDSIDGVVKSKFIQGLIDSITSTGNRNRGQAFKGAVKRTRNFVDEELKTYQNNQSASATLTRIQSSIVQRMLSGKDD